MLTVKYQQTDGTDEIFEATAVKFTNRESCPTALNCKTTSGRVEFIRPNAKEDTLAFAYAGLVYVMNEAGKTVAKYDLGGWPIMLGELEKNYVGEQRLNTSGQITGGRIGGQIL